jgi:hypothetical protein
MHPTIRLISLILIVFTMGCSKKTSDTNKKPAKTEPAIQPQPSKPLVSKPVPLPNTPKSLDIDSKGNYKQSQKLPPRFPCKSADDCDKSRFSPGKCCKTKCPTSMVGGTKQWVLAVKEMWKKNCKKGPGKKKYSCSYPKCYPRGIPTVACIKNKCSVEYKSLR